MFDTPERRGEENVYPFTLPIKTCAKKFWGKRSEHEEESADRIREDTMIRTPAQSWLQDRYIRCPAIATSRVLLTGESGMISLFDVVAFFFMRGILLLDPCVEPGISSH